MSMPGPVDGVEGSNRSTPAADGAVPDLEGTLVAGKYRVEQLLGTGGMGTVWKGRHEALGTPVAIKFIKPQHASAQDARRRFEIEARAAAKLNSKHAVKVFDYGVTESGLPYIVMEYLEGESLSEALIRRGPLPASEVGKLFAQAARALQKAHDQGIVHRDLKPDNIFLQVNADDPDPELPYTVKLVDFGIAKVLDAPGAEAGANPMGGPTQDGAVIGTPNFMAPEQLTVGGAPNALTDLWSLGACAFAAMTARIPFEGDVLGDIVLKVCAAPLPVPSKLNPDVPPGFDAWFARACSRDPQKRFQSATELADSLNAVCGNTRIRTATLSEDQVRYALKPVDPEAAALADDIEIPSSMSPKTALMAGLVLGVAIMVGILGFIAWREKDLADQRANAPPPSASPSAPLPSASPRTAPPTEPSASPRGSPSAR
jgi:serine/threonine-protein kinase